MDVNERNITLQVSSNVSKLGGYALRNYVMLIGFLYVFFSIFIPSSQQTYNDIDVKRIKQTFNLASKVLVNSIDLESMSYETFSLGYYLENEDNIEIDKERLVTEFNDVLYKRFMDKKEFLRVQRSIPALLLTYGDRFYVAERKISLVAGGNSKNFEDYRVNFRWDPPMYYTVVDDLGRLLYLNVRDETSTYYQKVNGTTTPVKLNNSGVRVKGKVLTKDVRDKYVLDKINTVVQTVTYEPGSDNEGFRLQISEAGFADKDISGYTAEQRQEYFRKLNQMSNFNVLEGITFFIVYASDTEGLSEKEYIRLRNYNTAGFTLWKRY